MITCLVHRITLPHWIAILSLDLNSTFFFLQWTEVGQAGQVGRLAHERVAWDSLLVQEVARTQSLSLAENLALASPKKESLVKILTVVSLLAYRF